MPPSPLHLLVADPDYPRLKNYLIAVTGLAYYADKDGDLAGRIAFRLGRANLPDCAAYLCLLESGARGEEELDALIEDLTIGETFFFRHREMFDALRDTVLPELIARNRQSRQLRIWSAGCSTGAEPYSVAILLRRDLADSLAGWQVTLIGTDINREFLSRARDGCFEEWAFRGTLDTIRQGCFARAGTDWHIAPQYKESVSFQYHNLVAHPFPSLLNNLFDFDLILCRNVTIYFCPEIVRRLIGQFHQSLVAGGWLLVGHSEPNTELFGDFETVNAPGAVLYRKALDKVGIAPDFATILPPLPWSTELAALDVADEETPPAFQVNHRPVRSGDAPPNSRPEDPGATADLIAIRALIDQSEWNEATHRCQLAEAQDRLNPVVHFYQALVAEQANRHADAEQALRRAIYLDRGFTLAHYYLGLLLQQQGHLRRASRSFQNVLQLLSRVEPGFVFADADGITAAELAKLTQMHLHILEQP